MHYDPHVYFIEIVGHGLVKIGTSSSPIARLQSIKAWCPFPMNIMVQVPGGLLAEAVVHDRFRDIRHQGEWFYLTEDLAAFIEEARATGLPCGSLLPDSHQNDLTRRAKAILGRAGVTFGDYYRASGRPAWGAQQARNGWLSPKHVPAIIRFMAERGITVHPSDFLEDNDAARPHDPAHLLRHHRSPSPTRSYALASEGGMSKSKWQITSEPAADFDPTLESACAPDIQGWMPISTYDKTAHHDAVLVYCPGNKCTFTAWWSVGEQRWEFFGGRGLLVPDSGEPSHWQDTPEPPVQP